MSRRAARSKLCPTPSKGKHYTVAEAIAAGEEREAQARAAHLPLRPLYTYQCACLWWHRTRHPYSREGQPNHRCTT